MRFVSLLKSIGRPAPGVPAPPLPPLPRRPSVPPESDIVPVLRPFTDACYGVLAGLALPFYALALARKPAYRASLAERFGSPPRLAVGRPRVWIHGVSVGEVMVARPLVELLAARHPEWDLVFSTTTTTGQEVARKTWPDRTVFYMPVDLSACVRSTLARTRPDLIVLIELEVWPNHLMEARRAGVPVVIVNGRVTEDALRRYRWVIHPWRRVMGLVNEAGAQNDDFAGRLVDLGVPRDRVRVTGNMKYDAVAIDLDPELGPRLRRELGIGPTDPVLIGGSTHEPEEEHLLNAWAALRRDCPALRLVLVPRHPERWSRVEDCARARGCRCLRRSRREGFSPGAPAAEVLLLDTMGELRAMYAAADVVFVGGSLIPHGGQNLLEPAALAKPVVHGPHMFNFADGVELLAGAGAAFPCPGSEDLAGVLGRLVRDPALRAAAGAAGRDALVARRGATPRNAEIVERWMERAAARKTPPSP